MNNCLADLARLLPPSSLRKGRGRIEKTEIVELAIKHLRHLQCHPCPMGGKNLQASSSSSNSYLVCSSNMVKVAMISCKNNDLLAVCRQMRIWSERN